MGNRRWTSQLCPEDRCPVRKVAAVALICIQEPMVCALDTAQPVSQFGLYKEPSLSQETFPGDHMLVTAG